MAESIWKWFLRLLVTAALLLTISILGLVAVNVPGAFDNVSRFGDAAEKAAESVTKPSERTYDASALEHNHHQHKKNDLLKSIVFCLTATLTLLMLLLSNHGSKAYAQTPGNTSVVQGETMPILEADRKTNPSQNPVLAPRLEYLAMPSEPSTDSRIS